MKNRLDSELIKIKDFFDRIFNLSSHYNDQNMKGFLTELLQNAEKSNNKSREIAQILKEKYHRKMDFDLTDFPFRVFE